MQWLDILVIAAWKNIRKGLNLCNQIRLFCNYALHSHSLNSLQHSGYGTVRHLNEFENLGAGTNLVQILFARIFLMHIYLRGAAYNLCGAAHCLYKAYRLFSPYGYRKYCTREEHGISQCKYRERLRHLNLVCLCVGLNTHNRKNIDISALYLVQ